MASAPTAGKAGGDIAEHRLGRHSLALEGTPRAASHGTSAEEKKRKG